MMAADIEAGVLALPALVNRDEALVRRGRYLTTTFLVEVGAIEFLVRVVEGRIAAVERGPFLMRPWSFALRAPADAWQRFWPPLPDPGYHDLFAMSLLTGEYDFSCTLDDTRQTAEKILGARLTIMTEIGHSPMSENPAQFRKYLLPVLDEIRAAR